MAQDLSGIALHVIICLVIAKLLLLYTEWLYILIHIMNTSSLVSLQRLRCDTESKNRDVHTVRDNGK